jgi:mannose-6-phosphate isomerase
MLYPFTFRPIFKERLWGGRKLEELYKKKLPAGIPIGESWEVSDRPQDESVISNGPLAGKTLRWLMEHHPQELLGNAKPASSGRFPLLIKILDAQEKLSLQVHPPRAKAAELGGEPKTEMWYVADATPEADLYVGLKRGVTRAEFEQKIQSGNVAECFHRIPVRKGNSMFLQSGRVHALGAGNVIFEIQQNSDTTYRVFDWNRVDTNGKPRELHIPQSLESIDFNDFEPSLTASPSVPRGPAKTRALAQNDLFTVNLCELAGNGALVIQPNGMQIFGVLEGQLTVSGGGEKVSLVPGDFCLVPAVLRGLKVDANPSALFLEITAG